MEFTDVCPKIPTKTWHEKDEKSGRKVEDSKCKCLTSFWVLNAHQLVAQGGLLALWAPSTYAWAPNLVFFGSWVLDAHLGIPKA